MLALKPSSWGLVGSALAVAAGLLACSARPTAEPACLPEDPWVDEREAAREYQESEDFSPDVHAQMLRAIGFCEYEHEEMGDVFPNYEWRDVDFYSDCRAGDECQSCDPEEVDDYLRSSYAQAQEEKGCAPDEREVLEYERGCVAQVISEDTGEPQCCYSAVIVSECPVY